MISVTSGALPEFWGNYLLPFDEHVARVGSVYGTPAYIVRGENLACLAGCGNGEFERELRCLPARATSP
jgi:hypothetical protein